MPDTLPGFLMLAGLLLFVVSLYTKPIEVKETKLPTLNYKARRTVRYLGIAFMLSSAGLYAGGLFGMYSVQRDLQLMARPPATFCVTKTMSCRLPYGAGEVGDPCSCITPGGPVPGLGSEHAQSTVGR
jgi:hypothetical protein